MFIMTNKPAATLQARVKGLLIFNQENSGFQQNKPTVDEAAMKVNVTRASKIILHHLSSVDENVLEEFMDLGLDYIWKTMHCSHIKINLHHFMQDDDKNPGQQKLMGNKTLKSILKARTFRWK